MYSIVRYAAAAEEQCSSELCTEAGYALGLCTSVCTGVSPVPKLRLLSWSNAEGDDTFSYDTSSSDPLQYFVSVNVHLDVHLSFTYTYRPHQPSAPPTSPPPPSSSSSPLPAETPEPELRAVGTSGALVPTAWALYETGAITLPRLDEFTADLTDLLSGGGRVVHSSGGAAGNLTPALQPHPCDPH